MFIKAEVSKLCLKMSLKFEVNLENTVPLREKELEKGSLEEKLQTLQDQMQRFK